MAGIRELIERLERNEISNDLDIAIEIALFEPDGGSVAVRANNAGTKLIYSERDGTETTCLAWDWSQNSERATTLLRALADRKEGDA